MLQNNYSTNVKVRSKSAYDARALREEMSGKQIIPIKEIYIDIIERNGTIKREEAISHFSSIENCTYNVAADLFNRIRSELLLTPSITQPSDGYYQFV